MESVYRRGQATVAEIAEDLPGAPTDSAVRAMLRLLEAKGRLRRSFEGRRLIYKSTVAPERASGNAIKQLMRTFFGGSREHTVRAILTSAEMELTNEELARLAALIEAARRRKQ